MSGDLKVGMRVTFSGFVGEEDDRPANWELLVEGESYEISGINPNDDELTFDLMVPNPEYNPKAKKSKTNVEYITVDVFEDEVASDEEEEEEEEEQPKAKVKAKAKPVAKAPAKAPAKTTAKAPVKAKAEEKPVAKAKAKPAKAAKAEKPAAKVKPAATKSKLKEKSEDKPAKVEGERGMLILLESEEDADILAMCSEAEDLCELAKEACDDAASMDYRLGGILYHVRISGEYKELDPSYAENKGFANYVETELGIRYRKAMYLIDIYTKFNRYGIDAEKVALLGWTKASVVAGAMEEDNADDLIALAEESTVAELKDSIRETYSSKGDGTTATKVKKMRFTFSLVEDAGATIASYFLAAKESLQLESDAAVFEHIVNEWALEHLNVKKARVAKKKAA